MVPVVRYILTRSSKMVLDPDRLIEEKEPDPSTCCRNLSLVTWYRTYLVSHFISDYMDQNLAFKIYTGGDGGL